MKPRRVEIDHREVADQLSKPQRDRLVEHVDGAAWIEPGIEADDVARMRSLTSLANLGLIRFPHTASHRPRKSVITEDGRMVLAMVLADYAEALLRAGLGGAAVSPRSPEFWPLKQPPATHGADDPVPA